jgi:prepilin-type N-terminal cleavage/methylation domain-containing protein/prepilin-type processing-associated H-X9-DG protein
MFEAIEPTPRGKRHGNFRPACFARNAFTLIELLVVIAIIAILAALLLPALARAKLKTQGIYCMNNEKQLALAVQLYAQDFQEWFPPNPDDGGTAAGYEWCGGNVSGPPPYANATGPETFNPDYLRNPSIVLVAPYVAKSITVWKCPADKRVGPYSGTTPNMPKSVPATRSVSMVSSVGSEDAGFASGGGHGGQTTATSGSWLDGTQHGNKHNSPWATFSKMSDFVKIGPSEIFMTVDEDPYSINDAAFGVCAATPQIVDWPATYHGNACGFGFCDGHAEIHKWKSGNMVLKSPASTRGVPASDVLWTSDWTWLKNHATIRMP